MPKLSLPSVALEYLEQGSGYPVVLIHGSASDYRTWNAQLDPFGQKFHVLAYSRRYHWPNQRIEEGAEYSMVEQVEDLEQILRSADLQRPHLLGHSYGAYLALMVAIRNPDLVGRLVLAEPPVIPLYTSFPPKPQEILGLLLTRPKTALPVIRFAATGLGPATNSARKGRLDLAMQRFGSAVLGSEAFSRLSPDRMKQVHANFLKEELLSDSFMTPLDPTDVSNIKVPTLLVTGANSPRLFHVHAQRLAELIPNSERVDIPSASHLMHEDNAADYNSAVLAFLGR